MCGCRERHECADDPKPRTACLFDPPPTKASQGKRRGGVLISGSTQLQAGRPLLVNVILMILARPTLMVRRRDIFPVTTARFYHRIPRRWFRCILCLHRSRRPARSAARAVQLSNRPRRHMCQPATRPSTQWLMIVIGHGNTVTRVPVRASPENPTTVTVGNFLVALESLLLDLESTQEGNNQQGEDCLCLRPETVIDFYRERYGKAGLVKNDEGPYTWEWKVRTQL